MKSLQSLIFTGLVVAVFSGCATGTGNSGPSDLVQRVRSEIAVQYGIIGIDPALAEKVNISVKVCPPSGRNNDGPYVCGGACAVIEGCVHAWQMSSWHSDTSMWMFADPPSDWCIRHEVGHFVQRRWGDNEAEVASKNGHPTACHINGKLVQTRTLIRGARWPAFVKGLQFWRKSEGSDFGCVVRDRDGQVIGRLRINENTEGDGI